MKKLNKLTWAGIIAVFLLFALIRFPVSLAAGFLPGNIRLDGTEGTIWQGRASAFGLGGQVVQQDVIWKVRFDNLLKARLAWDISGKFAADTSKLTLSLAPTRIELRDVAVALPLEPFLGQDAKLKSLRLGGLLKLNTANFSPQRPSDLSVRLENLFSALTPAIGSLGSAEISVATQADKTATWSAKPLDGALAVSGSGTMAPMRGKLTGQLGFKPDEKLAASLRPVLSLLQQGANGEYTLALH